GPVHRRQRRVGDRGRSRRGDQPQAGQPRRAGLVLPARHLSVRHPGLDDAGQRSHRQAHLPLLDQDPELGGRVGEHHRAQEGPARMTRLPPRPPRDDGQVVVLVAVVMVAILGMAAFVIDVGSWFRQQRATQSVVDAAALAGAQALPTDPGNALTIAQDYGAKNGAAGELTDANIQILSRYGANDTIKVTKTKPAGSFFGKIFGVNVVNVHATATAMVGIPSQAEYVAPIAVNILHPDLHGRPQCPCYGLPNKTTLPLGKTGAPGAFDLLNLDVNQQNGTIGASTMSSWITDGYNKYLPLGG